MTLPASGAISLGQVNTELSRSATAALGLGDTAVRSLFGIATGAIDMNTGHGKSSVVAPSAINVLVVAGGGGSGYTNDWPGAGGAGGLCTQTARGVSTGTTYTVTVGGGGSSGAGGANSVFDSITANGGGHGSATTDDVPSPSGGSGGGGGITVNPDSGDYLTAPPGLATQGSSGGASGYGNNGVTGPFYWGYSGSGAGGGAGAAPSMADANGSSTGGAGMSSSLSGAAAMYAGGGGGEWRYPYGVGGTGGGGNGLGYDSGTGSVVRHATAGAVNTGGGGGASAYASTNGGSGIVIVAYSNTYLQAAATTGSPAYSNTGGNHVYQFTGSGSIRF